MALTPVEILFENDDVVLVNKPYGIVVHPGNGVEMEGTLAGQMLQPYPDLPLTNGEERPGVVHRLDKDTSGVLMFAKTEEALNFYIEQWKKKKVDKTYYALVSGILEPRSGTIEAPVHRDRNNRKRMASDMSTGKMAITHYEVVEYFPGRRFGTSLLRINIETGRTHQIRVHMAAIGHPVVGDTVYGRRQINGFFAKERGLDRQFLHATALKFPLMSARKRQEVESKIPPELQKVLDVLRDKKTD
ncbi:MAG: RluA family pseudouridine synthase [Candidatus Peregrinibacteria bacterium]|nr:RluA family pseudouridine synthase [Candidatus Peregrinibacteria bacterium]